MNPLSPDRLPDQIVGQQPVPAHHRPPNVVYDEYGRPVHVVLGQPTQQPIIVQMPEQPQQQGLDPALFRLIVITFLILAVIVVCTACVCAVVVLMGGTLIGIIGAVGQNLTMLAVCLVGVIVACGWAASKMKPAGKKR
ncbi:hypothetical protein [Streptomyces sp. NPDC050564]|uniref:hypothetical protein n=1 Tax=Streptomyces sp. NPDC050564 TaxID=3365631 RepID=UPI0037BB6B52